MIRLIGPFVDGIALGVLVFATWLALGLVGGLVALGLALLVLNWRYGPA